MNTLRNTETTCYEEKFISPFEQTTESGALRVLEAIRQAHPASAGWKEIKGYAEKLPNGKWRAVRMHKKIC